MSQQPCRFLQVLLSAFLLPKLLRLRIRRDIHCNLLQYLLVTDLKHRVEIPLRKKVTKSQTWRF